ncbi:MAG: C_GCAxxG_C_C family protein [Synergistales bacterium 57_84]|nr:MAG: C_GCAxxG_C_C family protein [Synergistales bacterium 57_84]HCP07016.1 hypothetical protein [Synergistaceae bacterium]
MGREEILDRIESLGAEYERRFGGCSQCVVGAIMDVIGGVDESVFKAATGLAGGVGLSGATCGALTGAVMVIGSFRGREYGQFADPERIRFRTFELARRLVARFEEEYGSTLCSRIQEKLMGRSFKLYEEDDHQAFIRAGGHDDKCPAVAGKAARWAVEILVDEGLADRI